MDKDDCFLSKVNEAEIKNLKAEQMEIKQALEKIHSTFLTMQKSIDEMKHHQDSFISEMKNIEIDKRSEMQEVKNIQNDNVKNIVNLKAHRTIQWYLFTVIIGIVAAFTIKK